MTTRSTPGKRGASKSAGARKKSKISIPGWIWLVTGLALGFFIAFLMGLTPGAVDVRSVASQDSGRTDTKQQETNKPVFDFYTLLPESEVTVQEEAIKLPSKTAATKPAVKSAGKANSKPKTYLLQAGSFRNAKDAERLRVQLLLEGLTPKVEKVNVGGGENWYRVQLGPFSDQSSLQSTQKVLAGKKIDSLLLQLK